MKQTLKIEFEETQKSVNAIVKLEIEQEDIDKLIEIDRHRYNNDSIFKEAQRLFEEAQKYSKVKTLQKNI